MSTASNKHARHLVSSATLTATLVLVIACGDIYADPEGTVFGGEDASSVDGDTDGGSATFPSDFLTECPSNRPRENSTCGGASATCEYGKSADSQCNAVLACIVQPFDSFWEPRPHDPCFSNVCPAGADVASLDGKPCGLDGTENDAGIVTDADEAVCNMTDGVCACTTGRDGTTKHPRQWICVRPLSVCPANRPLEGQSCSGGLWCDYGSCKFKRGLLMECKNGRWLAGGAPCQ